MMEQSTISPNNQSQQYLVEDANYGSVNREVQNPVVDEKRPITKQEWLTVSILCFVNLINYMDRTTIAGILEKIQNQYQIKNGYSGLLQTAFIISYMIFAPLFGYLGDRYSRKIIMSTGVFIWCITTFIGSYMKGFEWFVFFRMCVGIGEASYSTIAPTIISDLFIKDTRSKMLALFYFAIPVGSGLGYIIGAKVADVTGDWRDGLRVTPVLGIVAILLILFCVRDPIRGESEGATHLSHTMWIDDIKSLTKNPSFMLTTGGFTCVAFVTGALGLWAPRFLELGLELQSTKYFFFNDVSFAFGVTAMLAGLIGVPMGMLMAQRLRKRTIQADPFICGCGLLISAPLIFFAIISASSNAIVCFLLIFLGQLTLNLNWSIVADMLLYVVIPTRRSTAEAFQILMAHALGDAGSPYLIGMVSDYLKPGLIPPGSVMDPVDALVQFRSLQYALFLTVFVEVLGGFFFLLAVLVIEKDKALVDLTLAEARGAEITLIGSEECER